MRKNGTSDPTVAATDMISRGESRRRHARLNPTNAAAASLLPPPKPACAGMGMVVVGVAGIVGGRGSEDKCREQGRKLHGRWYVPAA